MPIKNKKHHPCFYKNRKEMDKPLSDLMKGLMSDICEVRGKLEDIKRAYGWEDRILPLEGGLMCMVVTMHDTMVEWREFEKKHSD